jgi:ABC-2 type transport system permease protein
VYRFSFLFDVFQSFVTPLAILTALSFARSSQVNFLELLPYYLVISIFTPITQPKVHDQLYEITRTGDAGNYLVKPISLYLFLFSRWLSLKLTNFFGLLPGVILLLLYLVQHKFVFSSLWTLPLAFILYFNLSYLCGLLSFWLEEFWAIVNLFEVITIILGGILLPYTFFPSWLSHFIFLTPFPYTTSWLARTHTLSPQPSEYFWAVSWIVLTLFMCIFLEKRTIKRYSLVGH